MRSIGGWWVPLWAVAAAGLVPGTGRAQPVPPEEAPAVEPSLPAVAGASVELSWEEVRALLDRLIRSEVEGSGMQRPPVDSIVRSAALRAEVGDGVLLVEGTVEIEVLASGWTVVPIFPAPAALRGVSVAGTGEPARLAATATGGVGVLFNGASPQRLQIGYAVAVDDRMGPKAVPVPVPAAGSVELTFLADSRIEEVTAEGAVRLGAGEPQEDGRALYRFAVRDPAAFVLRFVARRPLWGTAGVGPAELGPSAPTAEPRVPRYRSEVGIDVSIDQTVVRCGVGLELAIHDAPIDAVTLDPLPGWDVVSATLEGSEEPLRVEAGAAGLVVHFPYPVEERALVVLQIERGNEQRAPSVTAPMIAVQGAYRQEGRIGFRLDSTIEGTLGRTDGGSPTDPSEVRLPGAVLAQQAFRFHRVPYTVEMALRYHEPREVLTAAVERAYVRAVATREGKTVVEVAYDLRNSRHAYLAVTLPAQAEPWGAFIDGRPVQIGQRADRPQVALIALPRPEISPGRPALIRVELTYFLQGQALVDFAGWRLELPRVDVPIASLDVQAFLPEELHYQATGNGLKLVSVRGQAQGDAWVAEAYREAGAPEERVALENKDQTEAGKTRGLQKGMLAARFELPRQGTVLAWHGAVFLPDERVVVEVASRPVWLDRLAWWGSVILYLGAGMLAALAAGAWSRGRKKHAWTVAGGAVLCGILVPIGSFFVPVAGPYPLFVGFVIAGALVGLDNLRRYLLERRAAPPAVTG